MAPLPPGRPRPVQTEERRLFRSFEQQTCIVDREFLKETFDAFDKDGSGAVDFEELEAMVTSMGMEITPIELYEMLKEADEDGNEEIDFEEFTKVIENHVERSANDPDSPGGAFAKMVIRKAHTGPPMEWRADKLGPGMKNLENNPAGIRKMATGDAPKIEDGFATGKWGVQLLSTWLSTTQYSKASVLLVVDSTSSAFMVGVVGSNYNPTSWATPLDKDKHTAGVRAQDGHAFVKGKHRPHCTLCPMPNSGATRSRIGLDIDMAKREMRITFRPEKGNDEQSKQGRIGDAEDDNVGRSIVVDDLPVEVAVAIAFGPSESDQTVFLVGSSCERDERRAKDRSEEQENDDEYILSNASPEKKAMSSESAIAQTMGC